MSVMSPLMLIPTKRPKQIQKKGHVPCQAINAYRAYVFAEQATVWSRDGCHNRKDEGFEQLTVNQITNTHVGREHDWNVVRTPATDGPIWRRVLSKL